MEKNFVGKKNSRRSQEQWGKVSSDSRAELLGSPRDLRPLLLPPSRLGSELHCGRAG